MAPKPRTKTDQQSRDGKLSHQPQKSVGCVYGERYMLESIYQEGKF